MLSAWQSAPPANSRVRCQNDVCLEISAQLRQEVRGRRGFPEKLVNFSRAAMAQEDGRYPEFQPNFGRQRPQPLAIFARGIRKRVVVTDRRKVIVSRVRIAATTIRQGVSNRMIVVALQANHIVLVE